MTNATATDTHLPNNTLQTDGLSREEVRGRSAGMPSSAWPPHFSSSTTGTSRPAAPSAATMTS